MGLTGNDFSQDSGMTDVSCMGCMFQDMQNESRGFLSVVFCLTNVKLLPPALSQVIFWSQTSGILVLLIFAIKNLVSLSYDLCSYCTRYMYLN